MDGANSNRRTIWILTHKRVGDRRQMEALARALGWPTTIKTLAFRPPNVPVLAPILLDRANSDAIGAPWPDLVLCAEARTSVIARLIRKRSKGAAKIVCLGRPAGSPKRFDLVLTTAQYRLPKAPQVVELSLPISGPEAAESEGLGGLEELGPVQALRPFIAVLVGGTAAPEVLDEQAAIILARDMLDHAGSTGGSLLVITGPRTSMAAGNALAKIIRRPHIVHIWKGEDGNPYRRFLAAADGIVVTSDSVSMTADALATGKPVLIYRLPRRWTFLLRVVERIYELTWGSPNPRRWLRPLEWLLDSGLVEPCADRRLLFDRLAAEGRLRWFGSDPVQPRQSPKQDIEVAVAAIERLCRRTAS